MEAKVVGGLVAAAVFGAGVVLETARAEGSQEVRWECGSFEVPPNTWSKGKDTWVSMSENGLMLKAEAAGKVLPSGWIPFGGAGNGPRPAVIACHPSS